MQGLKIAEIPKAGAIIPAEDQVVGDPAVKRRYQHRQSARRVEVAAAWPGIAAWMIVRENYRRRPMHYGVDDNFAEGQIDPFGIPFVRGEVDAARLVVQMGDPQCLFRRILFGKAIGEKRPCGGQSVELQREFGTLIPHDRAVLEFPRRNDGNRVGFGR